MKKIKSIALITAFIFTLGIIFLACTNNISTSEGTILRLHIRANSNTQADQDVKLKVRDEISAFLEKELSEFTDLNDALKKIETLKPQLKQISDKVLTENDFNYTSQIKICNEFFPTRMYESLIVQSGYYDALIINLGTAQGDNWWCVIYPPLCYIEAQRDDGFRYKSKLKELIKKYFS